MSDIVASRLPRSTDTPYPAVSASGPRGRRDGFSREELVADIAALVRPAVPDLPAAEFEALVRRMADVELKYRDRFTPTWSPVLPPPGTRER